jgi:hypothetical protein
VCPDWLLLSFKFHISEGKATRSGTTSYSCISLTIFNAPHAQALALAFTSN